MSERIPDPIVVSEVRKLADRYARLAEKTDELVRLWLVARPVVFGCGVRSEVEAAKLIDQLLGVEQE